MKALSATTRTALALLLEATLIFGSVPPFGPFVIQAEARIGRPATPMSYAGVARRTTRRAAGYGVGRRGRLPLEVITTTITPLLDVPRL